MDSFNKIKKILREKQIVYERIEHEHIITSEEASKVRGMSIELGAKAIVLEGVNAEKEKEYLQAVLQGNKKIDYKKLKEVTGLKKLCLADPEKVKEITGLTVGSIPPFGHLWELQIYVDSNLTTNETMYFSAATHTDSIKLKVKDYLEIVPHNVVNFSKD